MCSLVVAQLPVAQCSTVAWAWVQFAVTAKEEEEGEDEDEEGGGEEEEKEEEEKKN